MHTTKINTAVFLHNGDMSGEVKIREQREDHCLTQNEVNIPFETLEAFVIQHSEKIKQWKSDSITLSWQPLPAPRGDM
jgi:hypothetical protein